MRCWIILKSNFHFYRMKKQTDDTDYLMVSCSVKVITKKENSDLANCHFKKCQMSEINTNKEKKVVFQVYFSVILVSPWFYE